MVFSWSCSYHQLCDTPICYIALKPPTTLWALMLHLKNKLDIKCQDSDIVAMWKRENKGYKCKSERTQRDRRKDSMGKDIHKVEEKGVRDRIEQICHH